MGLLLNSVSNIRIQLPMPHSTGFHDSKSDISPHAYYLPVTLAALRPLSRICPQCPTPTVLLLVYLAHHAMHWPGCPLACPRAEAAVLAASRAAQRAQAPLVPAAHLSAPGPVHSTAPQACTIRRMPLLYSRVLS